MTREEEIRQEALSRCSGSVMEGSLFGGFIIGAKWADEHPKSPWISVEERIPEEDPNDKGYSVEVIGIFPCGNVSDCFCSIEEDIWFTKGLTCDRPTHWMPIPELKKG